MHQNYDEDPPIYALMLTPVYEDGAMHVKVGVAIPDGVDEQEEAIMMNALTLLYAAFDLMNSNDKFLNKVKQRQEELVGTDFTLESIVEDAQLPKAQTEYLDEDRKVIKLDFTTQTKGRA